LLTSDFDLLAMRVAVGMVQRFVAAPAWKGYILGPSGGLADVKNESDLDGLIRQQTIAGAHIVGTAAMSATNANYGVVNPDLRIKGATSLRIIDTSVFVGCLALYSEPCMKS